jgi:hypothetical protein
MPFLVPYADPPIIFSQKQIQVIQEHVTCLTLCSLHLSVRRMPPCGRAIIKIACQARLHIVVVRLGEKGMANMKISTCQYMKFSRCCDIYFLAFGKENPIFENCQIIFGYRLFFIKSLHSLYTAFTLKPWLLSSDGITGVIPAAPRPFSRYLKSSIC